MAASTSAPPAMPVEEAAEHAAENLHEPGSHTTATTEAEHGSGGLPQFQFQHWGGQVAYLLILFAILYLLIAKVFWPRIRRVTDERSSSISGAIEDSRRVQAEADAQAEAAKAETVAARARAQRIAGEARDAAKAETAAREAAEQATLDARLAAAETEIRGRRDQAMTSVRAIAAETATAMVAQLTGEAPDAKAVDAALTGAA